MKNTYDVIVAGAGPTGLGLAHALAKRGLKILCADANFERPWENNTCAWSDQIEPLGLDALCDRIWDDSLVIYDEKSSQLLQRRYAHFDNARLKRHLLSAPLATRSQHAVAVRHDSQGSEVTLSGGEKLRTTLVVDATGHDHRLISPLVHEPNSFQNVYGILARVDGHPFDLNHMVLMDFRSRFQGKKTWPPTFLYAMPYEKDFIFLEETSLAANPGVPFEFLKERLEQRLSSLDLNVRKVESIEQGALPMNPSVPDLNQRVIGFGAAASLVHPSTGWCVAHSLRLADPVANTIVEAFSAGYPPEKISRLVWRQMWPADLLRMRAIHLGGLSFFCRIGIRPLALFMKFFFNAAPGDKMWREYLSNSSTLMSINRSLLPW